MQWPLIIRTKHFPCLPFAGISLCGFIFVRKDVPLTERIVRHETIHFRQQLEWLFLPFFVVYFAEFLVHYLRNGRKWHQAYANISFEREAYRHDKQPEYLAQRPLWANFRHNC